RRLRQAVRALNEADCVDVASLVALAGQLELPAGVTIDFEASKELGEPMIVLRLPRSDLSSACFDQLTAREREVAGLLAQGLSNKEIAGRLYIALSTVKDHVHRVLAKTGLASRSEVIAAYLSAY